MLACTDGASPGERASADTEPAVAWIELALAAKDASSSAGERPALQVPVLFASESREAVPVEPGLRAVGRGRSPSDSARIAFAFGVAEGAEVRRARCTVRATIRADSRAPVEAEFELAKLGRWQDETIELGLRAGEAFEIDIELEQPGGANAMLALTPPIAYAPSSAPPTVVLVTSDTHRGDHVEGATNAVEIRTPALAELAARGVFFSNCYSSTNVTVPSHVAMLTGLHPLDSGVTDNKTSISDEPDTLAEVLRSAGFRTAAVTSLNLLSPPHANIGQGFDLVSWTHEVRSSDKSVDIALRHLDAADDRPLFLWLHVFDAHGPYQPPAPFDRAFYPAGRDPADLSIEIEEGARIPHALRGVRDVEFIRALYRGEIGYEDSQLARLFAHPRAKEGVVAFTADHGEVLGAHDIWWSHRDVYPDTLHVPLILTWPGAPAGAVSDAPVLNLDIARTLLDLAGLAQRGFPGRNLVEALAQPARGEPRFGLSGGRRQASIELDGWHLVLQLVERDDDEEHDYREMHQYELFHLPSDPQCARDLAASEHAKTKELWTKLLQWLAGWRGERLALKKTEDAATLQGLAELGYASDEVGRDASEPLFDERCACPWCTRLR